MGVKNAGSGYHAPPGGADKGVLHLLFATEIEVGHILATEGFKRAQIDQGYYGAEGQAVQPEGGATDEKYGS